MKKPFILLFFSLLLYGSCSKKEETPPPPKSLIPEIQHFTGTKGGFEINYATETWKPSQDTSYALYLEHKGIEATFIVQVEPIIEEQKIEDLRFFADLAIAGMKQTLKDFKHIAKGDTTLGGEKSLFYTYTATEEGVKVKATSMFCSSEKNLYHIMIVAGEKDFDKVLPDVNKILSSFKFIIKIPIEGGK